MVHGIGEKLFRRHIARRTKHRPKACRARDGTRIAAIAAGPLFRGLPFREAPVDHDRAPIADDETSAPVTLEYTLTVPADIDPDQSWTNIAGVACGFDVG